MTMQNVNVEKYLYKYCNFENRIFEHKTRKLSYFLSLIYNRPANIPISSIIINIKVNLL